MSFQDIISSKTLPSHYSNYYKQLSEPQITQQGNKKIITAKIQWNGKDYEFTWVTTLANDIDIKSRFDSKINAMLALAIRYKLGEKTTKIEYNPLSHAIERYKDDKKLKPAFVEFDEQLQKVSQKIKTIENDKNQADKLKALQARLKVITWTKNIFDTLKKMNESEDVLEKLEAVKPDQKNANKKNPLDDAYEVELEKLEAFNADKQRNQKKANHTQTFNTKLNPKRKANVI